MAEGGGPNQAFDQALEIVARAAGPELARAVAGIGVDPPLVRVTDTFVTAETDLAYVAGEVAVHIEMQARPDQEMGARMLLYAGLLVSRERVTRLHQIELVVRSEKRDPEQRSVEVGAHVARWTRQSIASLPQATILSAPGLSPLASGTGTNAEDREARLRAAVRRLADLEDAADRADLLTATFILAQPFLPIATIENVFAEERAVSLLENSTLGEMIFAKGLERGLEQGLETSYASLRQNTPGTP